MMDIEKLLKENAGVTGYRIQTRVRKSREAFYVHRALETVRATETTDTTVTVYVAHDGKLGDSSFAVFASQNEEEVCAGIEKAVKRALLVSNEPYSLPEGETEEIVIPSDMADADMTEVTDALAEAVFEADSYENGSINATEVFVYRDEVSVVNSNGLHKTQVKHHAMIEAIPTWNEGNESVELYESQRFTMADTAKVTTEIDRRMQEVRDRRNAVKPETPMTCDVVLLPHEISSFVEEFADQTNYRTIYNHANLYQMGQDVQPEAEGDRLTVTMAGIVAGSEASAAFDDDGIALGEKTVISNGVVAGRFGDNRYGCYLGEKPTGSMRCMKVDAGSLSDEMLKAMPYLEVASMSGIQVDLYNDYIGGEIRLAYLVDGENRKPVTGITMSGKVSEVIRAMRLLDTVTVSGAYEGPEKLLLPGMKVL